MTDVSRGQGIGSVVTGYYEKGQSILLQGSATALRELGAILVANEDTTLVHLYVPQAKAAEPYDGFLSVLQVVESEGFVEVRQTGSTLAITGSKENLAILSESILFLANQPEQVSGIPNHLHIEYLPDHYYLASSSLPLVISKVGQ
ncbi:MAG TPA: hypothetical protein VF952_08120 [Chloroflexia bacterium]|jgi:hypothetical protein